MKKFRIVPKKDNAFWQLVQGMTLDDEQKELLKSAVIRHVEVCGQTNSWEIALMSQTLIPDALLQDAAAQIRKQCQLSEVIFYQDVIDIEDGIQKIKEVVDDDLQDVLDRLDALCSDKNTYTSFSGKTDDMDGNVKFVIETAAIESDDDK